MTTNRPDTAAEALARKALKPLGALVAGVFVLIGFASCNGGSRTPAPTVTVTAPAPAVVTAAAAPAQVTAAPADSDAVALLKDGWHTMKPADRKPIRDAWIAADGNPPMQRLLAKTLAESITVFPVTEAEALEFLAWTATQR